MTNVGVVEPTGATGGAAVLRVVAPEVAGLIDRLISTVIPGPGAGGTRLLGVGIAAVAAATGVPTPVTLTEEAVRPDEAVVASYAAQFALDVSSLGDQQRRDLFGVLGEGTFGFVQALWIVDVVGRLDALLDQLFGLSPSARHPPCEPFADSWAGIDALLAAVPGLSALDPVTSELVRLRLAGHHRCRLCQSLRSYASLEAGATDAEYAAALDGTSGGLDSPTRAALGLVDAFAWTPARLDAGVRQDLLASFTRDQLVEILLDTVRNAANKIAVAFAADAPHVAEGVEVYDLATDGTLTYGLAPPPGR